MTLCRAQWFRKDLPLSSLSSAISPWPVGMSASAPLASSSAADDRLNPCRVHVAGEQAGRSQASTVNPADGHARVKAALMVVGLTRHITALAGHIRIFLATREQDHGEHEGDVPHVHTTQPSPSRSPRYAPLMTRSPQRSEEHKS